MSNFAVAPYNLAGQLYTACNQAGATVTLINTSTATGFILSNPWGSGKKLVVLQAQFAYSTVPAAAAVVALCPSISVSAVQVVHTTPLVVYNADGSGAATNAVGKVDSSATTPVLPVYGRLLGYSPTTPATAGLGVLSYSGEGDFILVPGSFCQISYLTTAPVGMTSMTWVEIPIAN